MTSTQPNRPSDTDERMTHVQYIANDKLMAEQECTVKVGGCQAKTPAALGKTKWIWLKMYCGKPSWKYISLIINWLHLHLQSPTAARSSECRSSDVYWSPSSRLAANVNWSTSASVKDWRVSLHGIMGPPDQSPQNSGLSVNWPDPQPYQFSSRSNKKCARYSVSKICGPGKVNQNNLRFATHQCPHCQISSRLAKRCTRKVLHNFFCTLHYSGNPREPLGSSSISSLMYSKGRTNNVPNFVPFWQPVSGCLRDIVVDFIESVTDRCDW